MRDDFDLILLVGAIAFVDAGGGNQAVALGGTWHGGTINSDPTVAGVQCARCAAPVDESRVRAHIVTLQSLRLMDENLHSPQRRLIELRIAHADLNSAIDTMAVQSPVDELVLRRLKKRRLLLRDQIVRLETELDPPEPA